MAVRNIKLTITYDGSEYHGWQIQPGLRTIQGVITDAIQNLLGSEVRLFGASRTDAGVSALGQVGLIQIDSPIPTENLAKAITDRLPADIAVTEAVDVPEGFDLMGAVTSKLYRYTIFTGPVRPVLQIRHCWHLPVKLDTTVMSEAARLLVGKNDWIYVNVEGDGFLYNMVRNIVGTLVEVGVGRWKPEKINEILEAKDRTAAGPLAPPGGLCLMWIKYD